MKRRRRNGFADKQKTLTGLPSQGWCVSCKRIVSTVSTAQFTARRGRAWSNCIVGTCSTCGGNVFRKRPGKKDTKST